MDPLVTVVMPTHNSSLFLKQSIESILKQSFSDFEFIIIDDGSTDESAKIIKSYSDPRIRLIENASNMGISKSMNLGVEEARGKYIARMDSDDISCRSRLGKQVFFLEHHQEIAACGGWIKTIGEAEGKLLKYPSDHEELHASLIFNSPIANPTAMLRKQVVDSFDKFCDPTMRRAEDYDMWVRLCNEGYILSNLQEVLLLYRKYKFKKSDNEERNNAKIIRMGQIKNLRINACCDEIEIHELLSNSKFHLDRNFVTYGEEWLKKIYSANQSFRIYSSEALFKVLAEKWLDMIWVTRFLGLFTWEKYKSSSFRQSASFNYFNERKFFWRCLIRV